MKFIEDPSLQQLISTGPAEHRRAATLVRAVAVAIAAAHTCGVIYRDLKTANILMEGDQQPIITNFGLAKLLSTDMNLTETGQILGSPSYMAPEQLRGDRQQFSVSADIYALGGVLYFSLTGRPPFRTKSTTDLFQMCSTRIHPHLAKSND